MSTYQVDPAHARLGFAVKHMMVSTVRGNFAEFSSTVEVDEANPGDAKIEVTIDANSVNTGQLQRDNHLRSGDFFEVEKFPTITFKSTKIEPKGGTSYAVTGDLTIHGVTQPVTLEGEVEGPIKDAYGMQRAGVELHGALSRKDYGLTYNGALEAGGVVIADHVRLDIEAEYTKAA
ncbi:MAG: YceI family protein [Candidatus Dormiibacterota bacterium]